MKPIVSAVVMVSALCSITAAQIRVDVALVNIVATVTDSSGRYVSGLTAADFIVEEDGRRQDITHFSHSNDLAVSVGIVLDTSTSMERKFDTAIRAVDRFIRDIHPDDDIFFMTFDEKVRVRQNFTNDREKLSAALYKARLDSGTTLYDALIAGVDKLKKGKHKNKAILLITDGVDTSSEHDFEVALLATRESEVLVYCLGISAERLPRSSSPLSAPNTGPGPAIPIPLPGLGTPFPLPGPGRRAVSSPLPQNVGRMRNLDAVDMTILDAVAEASGGKAWLITSGEGRTGRISDALDSIADELRSQYNIGYYPGHPLNDGKWHRVKIQTTNPRYYVRAKNDYFGSER